MATYSAQCSAVGGFGYANRFTLYVVLNDRDGNPSTNKSQVDYNVYFENTSGGGTFTSQTRLYFAINGSVIRDETLSVTGQRNGRVTIASGSISVEHNADGTKAVGFQALVQSSSYGISSNIQNNFTLNTIPRASSVSGGSGNIGSTSTISINRASSSFTHTLRYAFGSLSGTIATGVATSYNWTIPTSFYAKIPNAKSGTGTIYCDTYNGNTLIGTKSVQFTATASESACRPSISGIVVDTNQTTINLTGNANKLIKYKSTAKATITASGKNSASISKKVINGTTVSGNELSIAKVSATSFKFETVDSRGYSNSTTVTPSMVSYIPLTINANFFRPQPTTGEVKLTYSGNYFNGSFGAVSNTLSITWKYKKQGATAWTTGGTITPTLSGNTISSKTISLGTKFDYQTAYDFQITAVDKLTTITQTANVSVGMPVFYWGKDFFRATKKIIADEEFIKNNGYVPVYRGFTTNFNTALTHGFYSFASANITGSPISSTVYGTLEVIVQKSQTWNYSDLSLYIWQIYRDTEGREYRRIGVNSENMSAWKRIYHETTLYENSSGTIGTVTLSESSANFSYLEIFFRDQVSQPEHSSVRVYSPNGKRANLAISTTNSERSGFWVKQKTVSISGTSISTSLYCEANTISDTVYGTDFIYIYKVVGYR